MNQPDEDPLAAALTWMDAGHELALATVIATWGSSPRPRGSQLAIRDDGLFVGSVSGGCVEARVAEAALEALNDRTHRLLEFGVTNQEAWDVGLACGGTVRILVGFIDHQQLQTIDRQRVAKKAVLLVTALADGRTKTAAADDASLTGDLREAGARALTLDDASTVVTAEGEWFVQALQPPLKLVVIGAVHIAQPLTRMAALLGYEVTVVDPREAFARAERWPEISVLTDWPDEALEKMSLDHRTAIVTLTHDPKIDDVALESALQSTAFYIGALGSRKTHAARLERLATRGFSAEALKRIHGPVGLKIGAQSPAEIATSITAQMTELLRALPTAKPA